MTAAAYAATAALAPIEHALGVVRRRRGPIGSQGLAPGLVVPDPAGWTPARDLISGERLDDLLDAAARRWQAAPHAAAALAWRSYTYWLAMPPVLGWAAARRVPMLDPDDVLVRFDGQHLPVTVGLRRLHLAVLPDDPLAGTADVTIAATEQHLLDLFRTTLREHHLDPLMAGIQARVRLGTRTLLGSLASAVAYAAVRGLDTTPDETTDTAWLLLAALDVADLVDLPRDAGGQPTVQRHTCCLAFTLPEPKICSGCCLRR
jgi:hypothetical protein